MLKKGDKLRCLETLSNVFGTPLFVKDQIYDVIFVDGDDIDALITLNHTLIGNEYTEFDIIFINKHFVSIKKLRKEKLEKINNL